MSYEIADGNELLSNTLQPNLPGFNMEQRCFTDVVDFIPFYEIADTYIKIYDPIWGDHIIGDRPGDEILLDMVNNDLVRRSMGIEQLTLDPYMSTIPNTSRFSRWEHIWGGTLFVRNMI